MAGKSRPVLVQSPSARRLARRRLLRDRLVLAQKRLAQAEGLAQLGRLAIGLTDELVQPLTAVIGFAQRLQPLIQKAFPSHGQDADLLLEGSRRIAALIEAFRKAAQAESVSSVQPLPEVPSTTAAPRIPR